MHQNKNTMPTVKTKRAVQAMTEMMIYSDKITNAASDSAFGVNMARGGGGRKNVRQYENKNLDLNSDLNVSDSHEDSEAGHVTTRTRGPSITAL